MFAISGVIVVSVGVGQSFTVNLLRRDQHSGEEVESAGVEGKSTQQRFTEGVQRGRERAAYFASSLSPNAEFGAQEFQSPVRAGAGEYLMTLTLGTPPQQFSVIVDTGSDLNWVQCMPCQVCYQQPGPKFDPSKSSTFHKATCTANLCNVSSIPRTLAWSFRHDSTGLWFTVCRHCRFFQ